MRQTEKGGGERGKKKRAKHATRVTSSSIVAACEMATVRGSRVSPAAAASSRPTTPLSSSRKLISAYKKNEREKKKGERDQEREREEEDRDLRGRCVPSCVT